jgi:hypothetical protein
VPQVRYRVTTEGWGRVAESVGEYNVSKEIYSSSTRTQEVTK